MAARHGAGLKARPYGGDPRRDNASSTRGGDIGSSVNRTPVASRIALATAASGGTIGTSPTPRTPYGCSGFGDLDDDRVDHRQVRRDRHAVVEEARRSPSRRWRRRCTPRSAPSRCPARRRPASVPRRSSDGRPCRRPESPCSARPSTAPGLRIDLEVADVRRERRAGHRRVHRRAADDRAAGVRQLRGQLARVSGSVACRAATSGIARGRLPTRPRSARRFQIFAARAAAARARPRRP